MRAWLKIARDNETARPGFCFLACKRKSSDMLSRCFSQSWRAFDKPQQAIKIANKVLTWFGDWDAEASVMVASQ
jgi:hypothetical protein